MASPSPGLRRMVIRSVAGECVASGTGLLGASCPSARTADKASVDSDTPRERARDANQVFSSADRRIVIDARTRLEERQFIARPLGAADADAPLSCHGSDIAPFEPSASRAKMGEAN